MITQILLLIAGFLLLAISADHLVAAVEKISSRMKVSLSFLSLTLVALATSLPELAVSLLGLRENLPETVVGNIIGSNIANLGLALGLALLVAPIKLVAGDYFRIAMQMVGTCLFLLVACFAAELNRLVSLLLLATLLMILYQQNRLSSYQPTTSSAVTGRYLFLQLTSGAIGLWAGSELVVPSALQLGLLANIDYATMAVLVLALGTSLPEVVTCLVAARKKRSQIILGTIIGSSLMNILLIGGISGLVATIPLIISQWGFDLGLLFVITTAFTLLAYREVLNYLAGLLLVGCYTVYLLVKLFFSS